MSGAIRTALLFGAFFLAGVVTLTNAKADEDDHERHAGGLGRVDNPTYEERCGVCHFVYQPALLPSGSWCKILASLEEHNGKHVNVKDEDRKIIGEYLMNNAAEYSSAKRAVKIMRSLDGKTPKRITEVPYIRRKHDEIPEDAFRRESIGSRSNCVACHSTAEQGVYEEDYVHIPE